MSAASATLLSVRDLAIRAGSRQLLTGLDLDLAAGEIVALRGPSGSGKTTLLRTLALLQDPVAGEIHFRGQSPEDLGWPVWRRSVSLAPQQTAIFPGDVRANLARPFGYHHRDAVFPADRARALLDTLHLRDIALDADAARLSVGQQQRLGLARTLLLEPSVLLLDEPTSALDPDTATALEDAVRDDIVRRGAAVMVVTHAPERAARWCDRVLDLATFLERSSS